MLRKDANNEPVLRAPESVAVTSWTPPKETTAWRSGA